VSVAGVGAIGDGFDREGFVVARVEGELPGGPVGGPQCVGRSVMPRTRARWRPRESYTAYAARVRGTVCWVASGRFRLRRVALVSA
jgi:hypothetical protein